MEMSSSARRIVRQLRPWLTFLVIIGAWEIGCRVFSVPVFLLPSPSQIVKAGFSIPGSLWFDHIAATMRVVVMGYVAAVLISFPLALMIVASDFLNKTVYPPLVIIQSTPIVAVAPILVVTLGAGDLARVTITIMICFFPMVVGMATGLSQAPKDLIELSRSLDAPRRNEFLQIRLPSAIPNIFAALQVSVTLAVIGAVIAEFVAAEKGLGYFIRFSTSYFKIPQAFAGLAVLVSISLLCFYGVGLAQRILFPWSLPRQNR
jgi:NitT/TauT family transport system permease protein